MFSGVKFCKKLLTTPSLQVLGAKLADAPVKSCLKHQYDTDDYWRCLIRRWVGTYYHASGTCKMGASNDSSAVVDSKLR